MTTNNTPWTKEEFEAALRGMEKYYHIHHPYHTLMNEGKLTKKQLQGWVANRFYYQTSIPIKDANILANCPDRETRAKWTQRILDHDGHEGDVGGIEGVVATGHRCRFNPRRIIIATARFTRRAFCG